MCFWARTQSINECVFWLFDHRSVVRIYRLATFSASVTNGVGKAFRCPQEPVEIVNLLPDSLDGYEAPFRKLARSDVAYDALVGSMMLGLLNALRNDPLDVTLFASLHSEIELRLQYSVFSNGPSLMLSAIVDRPDYGPLANGIPNFHYRLAFRIGDSTDGLTTECRAQTANDALQFVRNAILATQDHP